MEWCGDGRGGCWRLCAKEPINEPLQVRKRRDATSRTLGKLRGITWCTAGTDMGVRQGRGARNDRPRAGVAEGRRSAFAGINTPYVLFKAKNVTDTSTRKLKWMKVRPIAPGTRHPMYKLLHYVGRAWSFVASQIPGEHFVINKTSEVPGFMRAASAMGSRGTLKAKVYDIEGCYPHMPKESIRWALRELLSKLGKEGRGDGVWVPKFSDQVPCAWKERGRHVQKIPFQVMLDVMDFSLDFAFIKMPCGVIKRQRAGIPMGDPDTPRPL